MGSGFALYFTFIKYCIWLLVVILAVSGVFNIVSNIVGEDCDKAVDDSQFCVRNYVSILHIANKRNHEGLLRAQLILHLIITVVVMLFFHLIRYRVRKISVDADDRTVTPSDFTVRLEGIPAGTTDEELRTWIQGFETNKNKIEIEKITRAYKILEYIRKFSRKSHIQSHIKKEHDKTKKEELKKQLQQVQEEIKEEKKNMQPTHVAFVACKSAKRKIMFDFLI